jgi:small subunit ribosomal protein S15
MHHTNVFSFFTSLTAFFIHFNLNSLLHTGIQYFYLLLQNNIKKLTKKLLKKIEMPYLTIEKKANIFTDFGGKATNTGSIEGQIALLTERINHISNHLKTNKKDFSSQRGLMMMVGQRKRLLTYLSKHDLTGYRALLEKLGLRK